METTPAILDKVKKLLEAIENKQLKPIRITKESWQEQFCGIQEFLVDDCVIGIFNDCDSADYIEYVFFNGEKYEDPSTFEDWDTTFLNLPVAMFYAF